MLGYVAATNVAIWWVTRVAALAYVSGGISKRSVPQEDRGMTQP